MAYDEGAVQRVRDYLADTENISEKQMFGGIAFMQSGNMVCGIVDDNLMARVGPIAYDDALAQPFVRQMDFTGKAMKGFVYIAPAGFEEDEKLEEWVNMCLSFAETLPPK